MNQSPIENTYIFLRNHRDQKHAVFSGNSYSYCYLALFRIYNDALINMHQIRLRVGIFVYQPGVQYMPTAISLGTCFLLALGLIEMHINSSRFESADRAMPHLYLSIYL